MSGVRLLLLGSTCLALSACASEVVRKRWGRDSVPLVQTETPGLSISSVEADAAAPPSLKDLPERSGAAYATALASKIEAAADYTAALAKPIKAGASSDKDRTALSRVIAIDVSPGGYAAGKRLLQTRVTMVPANFKFANYTLAKTDYQTIDLETVTATNKASASLTLSPSLGNVIEAVEATTGVERTDQSVYLNKERSRELSVSFSRDKIVITRDGAPGFDIAGVTILKSAVKPRDADQSEYETFVTSAKLIDDTGKDLPPDKAALVTSTDLIWNAVPLFVCARLDYVLRTVTKGAEFYDEGRQSVTETAGSTPPILYELVPEDDVEAARFGIFDPKARAQLEIDASTGARPFSFASLVEATAFAEWMRRTGANNVGGRAIRVLGAQIDARKGRAYDVMRIANSAGAVAQQQPSGTESRTRSSSAALRAGDSCQL